VNGWMGMILRVDLNTGRVTKEPLKSDFAHRYAGGRGFNSRILYDEVGKGTDPLGPGNKLIFGVGPCNGTLAPGSSRFTVTAKSPLSGFIGDSNSGGSFGSRLKYAGYDVVVIEGQAERPLFLWIDDDKVELRDARHLWGRTVTETRRGLEKEIRDPGASLVSIGPAGENLVKFASLIGDSARASARAGMGAVMGSKRLKAIAVRGTKGVKVAHRALLEDTVNEILRTYRDDETMRKLFAWAGTIAITPGIHYKQGAMPVRNYQRGTSEIFESISPERLARYFVRPTSCYHCPILCDHPYLISEGPFAGTTGANIEIGNPWNLGAIAGVGDPEVVLKASAMTNEYGLDYMEMGGRIAFAMECFEKGLLTSRDVDGLRLEWGSTESVLKLIEWTAYRHGIGDLLAEGIRKVADQIGGGSEKFALESKNLYADFSDVRARKSWGLAGAVSARGLEHCRSNISVELDPEAGFDPVRGQVYGEPDKKVDRLVEEGKGLIVKWYEDARAFENCMEVCTFLSHWYPKQTGIPGTFAKLCNAVAGLDLTERDVMRIGERVVNLERAFNMREGLTRKDDSLPDRFTKEPMPDGASKGQTVKLEPMLDDYYDARGWERSSGWPGRKKLMELDLQDVAQELNRMGMLPDERHGN
jgi:aldehyde:ferredoxin oxidoreductase